MEAERLLQPETSVSIEKESKDYIDSFVHTPEMKVRRMIHQVKARKVNDERKRTLDLRTLTPERYEQLRKGMMDSDREIQEYIRSNYGDLTVRATRPPEPGRRRLPKRGDSYDDQINMKAVKRQLDIDYPPVVITHYAPNELYVVGRYVSGYYALINNIRKKHIPDENFFQSPSVEVDVIIDMSSLNKLNNTQRIRKLEEHVVYLEEQEYVEFADDFLGQMCDLKLIINRIILYIDYLNGNQIGELAVYPALWAVEPITSIIDYLKVSQMNQPISGVRREDGSFLGSLSLFEYMRLKDIMRVGLEIAMIATNSSSDVVLSDMSKIHDVIENAIEQGILSAEDYDTIPELKQIKKMLSLYQMQREGHPFLNDIQQAHDVLMGLLTHTR